MKNLSLLGRVLRCAWAVAPGLALAQAMTAVKTTPPAMVSVTAPARPAVTDPAAAVPPVVYQSVFAGSPTGVEMESADWKKANAEVGQFKRGHVDILKWEEAQQAKAAMPPKPMADDAAKPAAPSAMPSPAPLQAPSVHKH